MREQAIVRILKGGKLCVSLHLRIWGEKNLCEDDEKLGRWHEAIAIKLVLLGEGKMDGSRAFEFAGDDDGLLVFVLGWLLFWTRRVQGWPLRLYETSRVALRTDLLLPSLFFIYIYYCYYLDFFILNGEKNNSYKTLFFDFILRYHKGNELLELILLGLRNIT